MSGVDILTVNKLLRHKTLQVTMRCAHLSASHLHDTVEKLDQSVQGVYSARTAQPTTIN
jgi:site-specific recombinase XerD